MAKMKWDISGFVGDLNEATEIGLDRGAIVIQSQAQLNLSRPGAATSKTEQKSLGRASRILGGPREGAFKRYKRASAKTKSAVRKLYALRKLGGLVDPPGGMPRRRTGRLARSITFDSPKPNIRRIGPSKSVPYAAIHEYGGAIRNPGGQPYVVVFGQVVFVKKSSPAANKPHTKFTKPSTTHMPARPYMRPSVDQSRGRVFDEFAKTIETVFPREVGK